MPIPFNHFHHGLLEGRLRSIITDRGLIIITERSMYELVRTDRGTDEISAARMAMAQLASMLSFSVSRPVVDGTRLTGVYRFQIELPSLANGMIDNLNIFRGTDRTQTEAPTGVSAVKAVEKLGLKLEPRRILLDTIVVDNIERAPTDN
jgi:uncharacterized protein (TIGR03435 family)